MIFALSRTGSFGLKNMPTGSERLPCNTNERLQYAVCVVERRTAGLRLFFRRHALAGRNRADAARGAGRICAQFCGACLVLYNT